MIKLVIASPFDGHPESAMVSWPYAWALREALGDPAVRMLSPRHLAYATDVCRARSRAVMQFLTETDGTHLLFWDTDVAPSGKPGPLIAAMLNAMLHAGHQWLGCPYPRKRLHVERGEEAALDGQPFGAHSLDYPFCLQGPDDGAKTITVTDGCVAVDRLAIGFTLISREALQRMWDHYLPTLWFTDIYGGKKFPGCAIFDTLFMPELVGPDGLPFRNWLSEDYAGCERWRQIGGAVHMYVGDGSPVNHVGSFLYKGMRDGLVYAK